MFYSLRIAFRGFFVDSEAEEKRDNDPVPPATGLCQLLPGVGEEYRAVGLPPHEASSLEARNVLGHGRRLYAKPLGDLDRPGLSASLDQVRDQLDVILRHFAFVGLAHGREPLRLRLWGPVCSFERLTPM